jgi:hypothetical protein
VQRTGRCLLSAKSGHDSLGLRRPLFYESVELVSA